MANILVGSPRFESITLITGYQSAVLTLKIDGVLRYTILKTGTAGDVITFEISELIRDYITQTFTGGQSQPINVSTTGSVILQYASLDGTGTPSGSAVIAMMNTTRFGELYMNKYLNSKIIMCPNPDQCA